MKQVINKAIHTLIPSGISIMLVGLMAFPSCTSHNLQSDSEDTDIMKFQVLHPDAADSRATETGFENNDRIGLFVTEEKSLLQIGGNYVNNAKLTYTAPEWKTETPVYWNNGTYDVYAYAPYGQSINSISDYQFSVALDQTSQGYNESDFLFASAKSQTASAAGVPLQFRHCMSRVCIRLVKGRDYDGDLPDDAKVYIHNTVPQATIDLSTGIATKYMYGREATIIARNEGNHKFGAILVPQRIDRRRPLFEVVMNGVAYLVEDNFVFRMGMCHTISLVISKAPEQVKIEIGGEIEKWNKEQ